MTPPGRAVLGTQAVLGLVAGLAVGVGGCHSVGPPSGLLPEPSFERMLAQRNYRPYTGAPMFADGRSMRPPPEGTVSRSQDLGHPALTTGVVNGRYVDRLQVPVDRSLVERGRDRFDVFCAACHGVRGDGQSEVARRMVLRRPPSLLEAPASAFPPGRVFQVISEGYGLMPSYSSELTDEDRWAVVAYVRALVTSQSIALAGLPRAVRARAEKELP